MSKKLVEKKSLKKQQIETRPINEESEESELIIGRKHLNCLINRGKNAEQEREKVSHEKEMLWYEHKKTVGILEKALENLDNKNNELENKNKLLEQEHNIYKQKKIKDIEYDDDKIEPEIKKKEKEKKLAEGYKEIDKYINEIVLKKYQKYLNK